MNTNSILLQNLSTEQLTDLIGNVFDTKFKDFQNTKNNQTENDDLMTREQVLELLQINASTLWHWTNKGRITVYKFANKCYYKRSELMATITPLKK
ncbi:helix-turn-helix domain-containing protein [Flavobacterium sp. LT1R49]|uniref:helix-turn-helix domain-containing protein n=1 Tax=Flavobacterium arabinosi TaxID=3398737 RepID=UPI003A8BA7A7